MATLWFALVGLMLAVYVVLDGFDLGAGALHLWVARTERERAACIRSVGPVWDGNEVWLIAAGGTLFFAFPTLYARSFSGFYLPLIMVLWLLTGRALGIELRHQFDSPLWRQAWDVVLCAASATLAFFFGVALGNIVRGVPMDASGTFFEPLFTDFQLGAKTGILDWYTMLVGVTALVALAHHGALWLSFKVDGEVRERARALQRKLWLATVVTTVGTTIATLAAQPRLATNLRNHVIGVIFPLTCAGGLGAAFVLARKQRYRDAFFASAAYLAALMGSAAFAVYPYVLPARDPRFGLRVEAAASPVASLSGALWWWIPALLITAGYFVFMYSRLPRVFSVDDEAGH